MRIYADSLLGGEWAHCTKCKFAGDLIELAAAAWRTGILPTVLKLVALGADLPTDRDVITGYEQQHVLRRKSVWRYWLACQKSICSNDSDTIQNLFVAMKLHRGDHGSWAARGSKFVGRTTREEFEEMIRSAATPATYGGKPVATTGNKIFRGKGWGDLIVIPFCDMPHRITQMMLIGRAAGEEDVMLLPVYPRQRDTTPTTPGRHKDGVAFLDTMYQLPHRQFGDTVFVFDNPVAALRLQLKWLRDHDTPLRLISVPPGSTPAAWHSLESRPYVFCSANFDEHTLRHVKMTNGRMTTSRTADCDLAAAIETRTPLDLLRLLQQHAAAWTRIVELELKVRDEASADSMLRSLQLQPVDYDRLIASCSPKIQTRIAALRDSTALNRRVVFDGHEIIESDSGWLIAKPNKRRDQQQTEVLCDAVVRISHAVATPRGRTYYRGVVHYQGKQYPFLEGADELDTNMFAWCRSFLRRVGAGELTYYAQWSAQSIHIAKRFNPPAMSRGLERIGWNNEDRVFAFPSFGITDKGQAAADCEVLPTSTRVPAADARPPMPLAQNEVMALSADTLSAKVFWAVAGHVCYSVLGPAIFAPPVGLALSGHGGQTMGRLAAKLLGCVDYKCVRTAPAVIQAACAEHGWPLLVAELPYGVLNEPAMIRNSILSLNWHASQALRINGGWHVLHVDEPGNEMMPLVTAAKKLVAAFLAFMGEQHLQVLPDVCSVFERLEEWFTTQGGDTAVIGNSKQLMGLREDTWTPVMAAFSRFLAEGDMGMVNSGFTAVGSDELATVVAHPNEIWVPQAGVNRIMQRRGAYWLDAAAVSARLGQQLLREQDGQQDRYWVLAAEWWSQQIRRHTTPTKLRLVD